ncbi:MAG: creatininase family protein [Candidatus Diapherotrites archaeon]|nr:creatininase family protein [Candidatus Diapherotrites archaeon]
MAGPFLFEQMSWKEIESAQKRTRTVVIPLSLLEEHGHHLPVSVDYLRAYEIAKRVKKSFFLLPPIIIGMGRKTYAYPGTVSVSAETLKRVIVEMCESLHFTGFRKMFVFSGHDGRKHSKAAEQAVKKLRKRGINASYIGASALEKNARERVIETPGDSHAGECETSEMMELAPASVRKNRLVRSFPNYPKKGSALEFRKANPSGVFGDSTKASRRKGKMLIDEAVKNLSKLI